MFMSCSQGTHKTDQNRQSWGHRMGVQLSSIPVWYIEVVMITTHVQNQVLPAACSFSEASLHTPISLQRKDNGTDSKFRKSWSAVLQTHAGAEALVLKLRSLVIWREHLPLFSQLAPAMCVFLGIC